MKTVKCIYMQRGKTFVLTSFCFLLVFCIAFLLRHSIDDELRSIITNISIINVFIWFLFGIICFACSLTRHSNLLRLKEIGVCYPAIIVDVKTLRGKSGVVCYAMCSYFDDNHNEHIIKSAFFSPKEPWHDFGARVYVNRENYTDYIVELYR